VRHPSFISILNYENISSSLSLSIPYKSFTFYRKIDYSQKHHNVNYHNKLRKPNRDKYNIFSLGQIKRFIPFCRYDIMKLLLYYMRGGIALDYIFGFSTFAGIFPLPSEAVDLYINEAEPDDIKVLLYVFRHSGGTISDEQLCKALSITAAKAQKSLSFWAAKKIFSFKPSPSAETAAQIATAMIPSAKRVVEKLPQYSAADIAKRVDSNAEIRFLFDAASRLLGKLLSPTECSSFVYLYDGAGLPADVILMLLEYCVSTGHANIRYIEKTALNWAEDGIDTHEHAESRIKELEALRSYEGQIKAVMGITGRALTQNEQQYLNRWALQWSIHIDLVKLAYEICVNRTGKLSFSYINSILNAWHEKGFATPEQAKSEQKHGVKAGKAPSYDIDEYVNLSMKRLLNE